MLTHRAAMCVCVDPTGQGSTVRWTLPSVTDGLATMEGSVWRPKEDHTPVVVSQVQPLVYMSHVYTLFIQHTCTLDTNVTYVLIIHDTTKVYLIYVYTICVHITCVHIACSHHVCTYHTCTHHMCTYLDNVYNTCVDVYTSHLTCVHIKCIHFNYTHITHVHLICVPITCACITCVHLTLCTHVLITHIHTHMHIYVGCEKY